MLIAFTLSQSACYYVQAARGQYDVLSRSEPIDEVLAAQDTPEELARRLELVQQARQFAIDELLLPDNDSYRSYADLERDYVVWNVFAAPEFSLEPVTWCFPVAGCVAYRGYFDEEDARAKAEQMREDGFDVATGGIPAYSTLGRFDDPVLNTMMRWRDTDLVATIFHELAHQVLYVKGDSAFNESFATAVEEFGVIRWLEQRGARDEFAEYTRRRELRRQIIEDVDAARGQLESLYAQSLDDAEKRSRKQAILGALQQRIGARLESAGRDPSPWLANELNNARLVPMALYEGRLPEFRTLYRNCEQRFDCFYEAARQAARR